MSEKHPFPYGSVENLVSFINTDYGTSYTVKKGTGKDCILTDGDKIPSYIKAFAHLLCALEQLYRERWFSHCEHIEGDAAE